MSEKRVSIRELKSRLSHYLRLTRAGESVVITDRGVAIGRIVPMGPELTSRVAAMRDAGHALWSGRRLLAMKPVAKARGRRTAAALVVEGRK